VLCPLWIVTAMLQKCGESQEHPRLRPPHIGYLILVQGKDLIVKVSLSIPHVIHGPLVDGISQFYTRLIQVFQRYQSNNALGHTVNINGIYTIVKIRWRTVFPEKVLQVEFESTADIGFEFQCICILTY